MGMDAKGAELNQGIYFKEVNSAKGPHEDWALSYSESRLCEREWASVKSDGTAPLQ